MVCVPVRVRVQCESTGRCGRHVCSVLMVAMVSLWARMLSSPVVQLPERAEKRASPMKKSLPFFGSTEYGDGAGAPKEFEHCPVEDIIQAAIDPEPAFRAPGAVGAGAGSLSA